jgi:hypothetical protein
VVVLSVLLLKPERALPMMLPEVFPVVLMILLEDIIKEVIPDVESSRSNNNNNTDNPDSNSPDTGISQPSPLPIVQNYLDLIRNRNYEPAWDMLPDSMKEDKQLHPNGYQSFYEWYNSISRLDVNDLSILESNTDSAAVKADLHYELSSGRELNFKLKFGLEFDSESRQWQIVAVKKI